MATASTIPATKLSKVTQFYYNRLSTLKGWRVKEPCVAPSEDPQEEFFGLVLEKEGEPVEKVLWFLLDDEGNGPGSFEIDIQ